MSTDTDQAPRAAVILSEITDSNRAEVIRLAVTPEQSAFVDGVEASLKEAAAKPDACPWFRAIYAGQRPVGFIMIADGIPAGHPEFEWPYYLWRLHIDADHVGQVGQVGQVRARWWDGSS
jgi:diamine N-acetyltransferase